MNDLLAFLLWPLALYVWSLSLNLWRAAWGNHLAELTEADVVPLWQLACFPPLSVVWSIDDSGRTNKIESHCMVWMQCAVHWACTSGMHCMLSGELKTSQMHTLTMYDKCVGKRKRFLTVLIKHFILTNTQTWVHQNCSTGFRISPKRGGSVWHSGHKWMWVL